MKPDRQLSSQLERDLSALADGTLAPDRRAAIEEEVAGDPALAAIVADQRRAVDALHGLAEVRAPLGLRERIEADRTRAPRRSRGWLIPAGGSAVGFAAIVALVVVLITGGNASAPSIADAAALTVRPATAPAPAPEETQPVLEASAGDIAFPNWASAFGWRAVGRRTDKIGGRHAVTVFYAKGNERIGYTIVTGTALAWPKAATRAVKNGTDVRSFPYRGRTVVTWRRDGQSCVMSAGRGVSRAELVKLAAWRDHGSLVY
jgi:hypothetical protein